MPEPSFNAFKLATSGAREALLLLGASSLAMDVLELTAPVAGGAADLLNATATVATTVTLAASDLKLAGLTKLALHGARNVTFTTAGVTPSDAPATATVTGTGRDNAALSEVVTLAQTGTVAASVTTFKTITSIAYPAADGTGATVSIGMGNVFGMPSKPKIRAGGCSILVESEDGVIVGVGTAAATATNQTTGLTTDATTATNTATSCPAICTVATPAAASANGILATAKLYSDGAGNTISADAQPDKPRNLTVYFPATWDGGTVTITGTDQFDAAVTCDFAVPGGLPATVTGINIFKTINASGIAKASVGVAHVAITVGTGNKLGLSAHLSAAAGIMTAAGVAENATFDATCHAVTPGTTVPNGSASYVAVVPSTVTPVQNSHTHTVAAHNHTQDAHSHSAAEGEGSFANATTSPPYGTYAPAVTPNSSHSYAVWYERDVA